MSTMPTSRTSSPTKSPTTRLEITIGAGYYAPGNDLVLYYGDQSYYRGIVILGKLEGDAAQRLSDLDGPVTATVEAHRD
jgi:hypothetical protein